MVLLGSLLNALFIIIGALVGRIFKNIPESMQQTVLSIIGLVVALLGIQMGLESTNFILLIVSLIIGAVIGEWLDLEGKFNRFGQWIESLFGKRAQKGTIAEGFVTATLIFVIGSMGILGALDSGLRNDHNILITKGIIDGFMSIILSSTLGSVSYYQQFLYFYIKARLHYLQVLLVHIFLVKHWIYLSQK